MSAVFVTGTDTGCGKTAVSTALVSALAQQGSACGYKPVAAGCELINGQWRNDDALLLQAASRPQPAYELVNPYALKAAIAPHIAAEQENCRLTLEAIEAGFKTLQQQYQHVVVEGAGGWQVPLSMAEQTSFSQIPAKLGIPVVLVVGLKLGCINHAKLTADAILAGGNQLLGWVANSVDPEMLVESENLNCLKQLLSEQLGIPLIAQFGFYDSGVLPGEKINLAPILQPKPQP